MGAHVARRDWSDHFSIPAADLIRIHIAFDGVQMGQAIMMRCFKRKPNSDKINETTVVAVLQELWDEHREVL